MNKVVKKKVVKSKIKQKQNQSQKQIVNINIGNKGTSGKRKSKGSSKPSQKSLIVGGPTIVMNPYSSQPVQPMPVQPMPIQVSPTTLMPTQTINYRPPVNEYVEVDYLDDSERSSDPSQMNSMQMRNLRLHRFLNEPMSRVNSVANISNISDLASNISDLTEETYLPPPAPPNSVGSDYYLRAPELFATPPPQTPIASIASASESSASQASPSRTSDYYTKESSSSSVKIPNPNPRSSSSSSVNTTDSVSLSSLSSNKTPISAPVYKISDVYPVKEGTEGKVVINPMSEIYAPSISELNFATGDLKSSAPIPASPLAGAFGGGVALISSGDRAETAREVRRRQVLAEKAGEEVPDALLLQGIYYLKGNSRRPVPTMYQRHRLYDLGHPYKLDVNGIVGGRKPKKNKK